MDPPQRTATLNILEFSAGFLAFSLLKTYFSAFLCKCLGILHHTLCDDYCQVLIIINTYVIKWWLVEFELSILLTQKCWYQRKMRTVFVVTCESALVCFTSSGSKFLNLGSTFRDFSTSSFYCSKQQGSASSFLAVSLPSQSEAFTVVKVSVVYSLLCIVLTFIFLLCGCTLKTFVFCT